MNHRESSYNGSSRPLPLCIGSLVIEVSARSRAVLRLVAQVVSIAVPVALIIAFTLFDPPDWLWLVPDPLIDSVGFRPFEMLLNVALFVPLGLSLGTWWPSRPGVLWWAIALSIGIELAQLGLPDRVSDPVDVVTNGMGAVVGFFAARWLGKQQIARIHH